jgi:hypothetical protein
MSKYISLAVNISEIVVCVPVWIGLTNFLANFYKNIH